MTHFLHSSPFSEVEAIFQRPNGIRNQSISATFRLKKQIIFFSLGLLIKSCPVCQCTSKPYVRGPKVCGRTAWCHSLSQPSWSFPKADLTENKSVPFRTWTFLSSFHLCLGQKLVVLTTSLSSFTFLLLATPNPSLFIPGPICMELDSPIFTVGPGRDNWRCICIPGYTSGSSCFSKETN